MERLFQFFSDVDFRQSPGNWEADEWSIAGASTILVVLVFMLLLPKVPSSAWDQEVAAYVAGKGANPELD